MIRVEHPKYGLGSIVEDETLPCRNGEVIVKFDNGFYAGTIDDREYAYLSKQYTEIVDKSELIEM